VFLKFPLQKQYVKKEGDDGTVAKHEVEWTLYDIQTII